MTNIKILLDSFPVRDQYMSLAIYVNGKCLRENQSLTSRLELDFQTELPLKIEFVTSDKSQFDTEVDEAGTIISDKHILIRAVCIDGVWVKKWILERKLFLPTSSNYLGQNGHYWFEIPYTDIMDFWLDTCITD